jgi:hypothetical protein
MWFAGAAVRKSYFSISMSDPERDAIRLHEGQGLGWLTFDEVLALARRIVPYDLGIIALHHSRKGATGHCQSNE